MEVYKKTSLIEFYKVKGFKATEKQYDQDMRKESKHMNKVVNI